MGQVVSEAPHQQEGSAFSKGKEKKYLRLREAVISHSKKLKNDFLVSATESKSSQAEWKAINKLLNRNKIKKTVDVEPGQLSSMFSSVYTVPSNDSILDLEDFCLPSNPLRISLTDVLNVLKSLKNGSPGPDGIPSWVLRDYSVAISPALTHIYQQSISTREVPSCLKRAFITPIPKCEKPTISDYRPISILPTATKVLEKIVYKRWLSPLSSKIGPNQFAFVPRQGQGTVCALTYVVHEILSFLDRPGAVRLVTIDMKKAFDRIPHDVILKNLISKGASKELIKWITSYLSGRVQAVKSNCALSDWFESPSGVPQGSVLAPLLFAFAIDNLQPKYDNSKIVKFADDICLLHFIRDNNDDHLQEEFNHVSNWCITNGLFLNTSKTKVMNFQTKNSLSINLIHDPVNNAVIEAIHSIKLLGIFIDDKLTWNEQIKHILCKIRKRVYFLHALRQSKAPISIMSHVYCALVRSVMSYSFPAWCNVSATRFKNITQFEKRLKRMFNLRIVTDVEDHCNTMCKRLANKASDENHPLHCIYDRTATRYSSRFKKSNRKIRTKTERFSRSFIRFA